MLKLYKKLLKEFGKQGWWPATTDNKTFEIIIGAILTQNTSWKNVEKAIKNLKKENLISIERILKTPKQKLAKLIKPSGYYNQKAEKLKLIAKFLKNNPEPTREELLKIKGIGPETADSILLYAFNKPYFVIDIYTKRIINRLGFNFNDYNEIQEFFTKNLPEDYKIYNEFHALLVELGKRYCKKEPLCKECPLRCRKLYK